MPRVLPSDVAVDVVVVAAERELVLVELVEGAEVSVAGGW